MYEYRILYFDPEYSTSAEMQLKSLAAEGWEPILQSQSSSQYGTVTVVYTVRRDKIDEVKDEVTTL